MPSAGLAYNLLRHSRAVRRLRGEGPKANEIWTIKRCLEWTKEYLAERGEEHPRLSAEWLLCAATGLARIDLYMRMDETLNAAQLETMHAAVVRRAKGEPLQYITGPSIPQTFGVHDKAVGTQTALYPDRKSVV